MHYSVSRGSDKSFEAQSDSSEAIQAERQYDAFGNLLSASGTRVGELGYGGAFGYQEDEGSGLRLLGHRYYDSSTGRFLTRDPIKHGRNWYVYCENDPVNFVDDNGLRPRLPTPEERRRIQVAINLIKQAGYGPEARHLQKILDEGNLLIEPSGRAGYYGRVARGWWGRMIMIISLEAIDGWIGKHDGLVSLVNIFVASILIHELVHVFQGWRHPAETANDEAEAYGAQLDFLYTMQGQTSSRPWLQGAVKGLISDTWHKFDQRYGRGRLSPLIRRPVHGR